jgi:hypothetical protein
MWLPNVEGETTKLEPDPADVTPQPAVYHFHEAPAPSLPPLKVKVDDSPAQIVVAEALIVLGAILVSLIVRLNDTQAVVLQPPIALR